MNGGSHDHRSRWPRIVGRVTYWLAVMAISMVLVFLLLAYFESRDASDVSDGGSQAATPAHAAEALASASARRAKTTIRFFAL